MNRNRSPVISLLMTLVSLLAWASSAPAQYAGWKHSGSVFVLTTPDGADLPASATVENFPLLVRLHKEFFDFAQAQANGDDLRFSSRDGKPLDFQIEEWDAARGVASIWVRMPKIVGAARQELVLHWGNANAKSASDGKAVFGAANHYLSVWHMSGRAKDEVGTLAADDTGTAPIAGVVGQARHFPGGKGIFGGDKIADYPVGSSPHTTEAWFRPLKPNANVVAWGNEHGQGKVVMRYRSPPHISMDCYFSDASVDGKRSVPMAEWVHVAHTYEKGNSRIYVNGVLDVAQVSRGAPLAIKSPARFWIGGWYGMYQYVGDIDEVRVSRVARSADWIRLQYENQKPLQTLVGTVFRPGADFGLSDTKVTLAEGASKVFSAKADDAMRTSWSVVRGGVETVVATNRLTYAFDAGRVVGDQTAVLRFTAYHPIGAKIDEARIVIREAIPEPEFTLKAPATWDGRTPLEIVPQIANRDALRAQGVDKLNVAWSVGNLATIREAVDGKLVLKRSFASGTLTVTASIDNGGAPVAKTVSIDVTQPARDAWVARAPAKDEMPVDGQFYARDDSNEGTLHCNGTLAEKADAAFLKVFANDEPFRSSSQKLGPDGSYAFAVKLKPGLVNYRVEFGVTTGAGAKVLHRAADLVCGDVYLINGQSNAVATDFGKDDPTYRSEWLRTFGSMSNNPKGAGGWGPAVHRSRDAGKLQIGYWGMELGRRLIETHKVPVCFLNGAVGGTRIDEHQRNAANPEDPTTIYGRLLSRVRQARLTHGVRGILWHQGENDQGADGPGGGFGWETYRQLFIDLAAAWKEDYPNLQQMYLFQIWPKACAMGVNGSDNRLREVQRNLPKAFSQLHIMSTLGIDPPGGCHYPAAGYAEFAKLIGPLVERDFYGVRGAASLTPPNLSKAYFNSDKKDAIVLEFDQPVRWDNALAGQFTLDGVRGQVTSGAVTANRVTLNLSGPSLARTITYLDSAAWSQKTLLVGANGIAALTFCEVPIATAR